MIRTLITVLFACVFFPGKLFCQATSTELTAIAGSTKPPTTKPITVVNPPEQGGSSAGGAQDGSPAPPPSPVTLKIQGRVTGVQGEMLSDATVWIATFTAPRQHLAETRSDSQGNYSLQLQLDRPPAGGWVVGASSQGGLEACELLDFLGTPPVTPVQLTLRKPDDIFEGPNPAVVDAWVFRRLRKVQRTRHSSQGPTRTLESILARYQRQPAAWGRLVEIIGLLRNQDLPQVRLYAATALMRVGAWGSAASVLGSLTDPQWQKERALLEGIRWNYLRRPEDAIRRLQQALEGEPGDALPQLELGRAYVFAEDWAAALPALDPALRDNELAPCAIYLRARSLLSAGDLEGAASEAKALTRKVKKKRLPADVWSFVADVRGRLEERSIQPVRSVLTQPVSELQKAVPNLASLDSSSPPPAEGLPGILKQVGANIESFFRDFSNTSALEVIRQARLDSKGNANSVRMAEMYYVFLQRKIKGQPVLEEFRGTGDGRAVHIGGLENGYMVTSGFASSLIVFHPSFQPGMNFRFLGRQNLAGRPVYVLGFAQQPQSSQAIGMFRATNMKGAVSIYVQGIAWVSADEFQILRLRTDLLQPLKQADLARETSEIDYRPYRFSASTRTFFLPSRVTVSIEWGRKRLRNEHIFSRFWLFRVDVKSEEKRGESGAVERPGSSGAQ